MYVYTRTPDMESESAVTKFEGGTGVAWLSHESRSRLYS